MENLMQTQELRLMYQVDKITDEKVMYKINNDFKNSIIVIGHTKYDTSVSNTLITKTVRTMVKLPTVKPTEIERYIQYLLGAKVPVNNFNDLELIAENFNNGVEFTLGIPARIATQEFALRIPRHGAGKAQVCIDAYIAMLAKYAKYDALVMKLTNVIRYAVRKNADSGLLKKMINQKTGLFDVELLRTLEPKVQNQICALVDKRLHTGIGKTDKNNGILKRQTAGAPSLITVDGEYIIVTTLFLDNKDNFAKFPDKFVEFDRNSSEFIQFRIDTVNKEFDTPNLTQEPTEETEEETVDQEDGTGTPEAEFPEGETVDQEDSKE